MVLRSADVQDVGGAATLSRPQRASALPADLGWPLPLRVRAFGGGVEPHPATADPKPRPETEIGGRHQGERLVDEHRLGLGLEARATTPLQAVSDTCLTSYTLVLRLFSYVWEAVDDPEVLLPAAEAQLSGSGFDRTAHPGLHVSL